MPASSAVQNQAFTASSIPKYRRWCSRSAWVSPSGGTVSSEQTGFSDGRGRDLLDVQRRAVSGRVTLNGMSDGHALANLDQIRVLLEELAVARDEAPAAGAEPEPEGRAATARLETAEADVKEEP